MPLIPATKNKVQRTCGVDYYQDMTGGWIAKVSGTLPPYKTLNWAQVTVEALSRREIRIAIQQISRVMDFEENVGTEIK